MRNQKLLLERTTAQVERLAAREGRGLGCLDPSAAPSRATLLSGDHASLTARASGTKLTVAGETRSITVDFITELPTRRQLEFAGRALPKGDARRPVRGGLRRLATSPAATPSHRPCRTSRRQRHGWFWAKTECFASAAVRQGEERTMPVRFVVDPAPAEAPRPHHLSYVFYDNSTRVGALN